MAPERTEGGCLCGAVRYRIVGDVAGSMICHCQSCRRLTAAPVVAWLTVAASDFHVTKGTPKQFRSSPPVLRSFCGRCGTHLFYTHEGDVSHVEVSTCSLDVPDAFPPTHHSWLSHDVAWLRFGDDLPSYPRSRYGRE
jgi:hypothetical protein